MPSERNSRVSRVDRDAIVATALRILDDFGLADVSMRRLASELGVQPSALYWHVSNKQELLAAVADQIVPPAPVLLGEDLSAASVARRLRSALLTHRDGAEVVLSTYALSLGTSPAAAALQAALRPAVAAELRPTVAAAVLQFVLGNASVLQQRLTAVRFGALSGDEQVMTAASDAEFRVGLDALLAGVTRRADPPTARS
ncbi:TetR family transcriptional regulator [Microbacterium nymphoidis]|uniref:TetR family transcriptional regulator n=1 Tax=Microbacterium nymphoidis TaxID=2898586 RepID=UPI001E5082B0|nr:TetR family transcriptional regulator [Microbacterium nymphoidis]MCD2497307.1 TetR family transcriptional regulator [Microbacterium nymphoidis]